MGCKGPMKGDPFCVDCHGGEILTTDIISKKHFLKVIGVVYIGVGNHLRQISGLLFLHFWIVWVMQKSVIELRKVDKEDSNAIGLQRSGKL